MLAWKRGDFLGAAQRLTVAAAVGFVAALIVGALHGGPVLSILGVMLAAYLIVGSFVEIWGRVFAKGVSASTALSRALGLPRSAWGTALAHAGVGVTLFGLAATGWGVEEVLSLRSGDVVKIGPYEATIVSLESRPGPNFRANVARTVIRSGGTVVATLEPARRFYPARQMTTSEAGIVTLGTGQIYVSLSGENADGSLDARIYWKPYVSLIWIGALLMALGGLLSLSDRRLRIAAGRKARGVKAAAAAE
jgi:cytochrome c-type biogenesis protein CcmF